MCWTTFNNDYFFERIARNNIAVKKVVTIDRLGNAIPFFCYDVSNIVYKEGEEYKTELFVWWNLAGRIQITSGFHSYNASSVKHEIHDYSIRPFVLMKTNEDIIKYSLTQYEIDLGFNIGLMECHIPTEALHYENERGEMVSNRLVVDNITSLI